jgi:hypothetical protein
MKTPSLRNFSAFFAAGAVVTMLAGTSCSTDVETEDLEALEALEVERLDARSGGHHHHGGHHHGGGEHGSCDPHAPPTANGAEIDLWPPNHKWHNFDVEDCLAQVQACHDWEARIIKITSDEPVNGQGDGNTAPDIMCDADSFSVRAERQGPGDGRVYEVYIEVEHGHHKKAVVVCRVEVDHDQGPWGDAVDSGDAYTVWCS